LLFVKSREKWIVFAIENSARVHAVGKHLRERAFPHANGAFNDNIAWSFERGNGFQLLCSGWHRAEL
jgi:hypothetical protein